MTLYDFLDSEPFYELMQAYRHAPACEQSIVLTAFERVKAEIVLAAAPVPCAASPAAELKMAACVWCGWRSKKETCPHCKRERDSGIKIVLPTAPRAPAPTGEGARDAPPPRELVEAMCGPAPVVDQPTDRDVATAPVAVALDPHRLRQIVDWVKAEYARHQLPLPPTGGGTRADLSLADALVLVREIERLWAVSTGTTK